jgi:hypothetical protein
LIVRGIRNRSTLVALAAVASAALVATVAASADDGGRKGDDHHGKNDQREDAAKIFSASLVGSQLADPPIHGATRGGAPWILDRGRVQLGANGRIKIAIRGLVIPIAHGTFPANTARPVATVSASRFCAPDSSGPAATTDSVPISADGNARIEDTLTLPSTCLAPTVLIHPNGGTTAYIALPGWRS